MDRIGKEQRFAILVPSERCDPLLNRSRHQEIDERACFGGLDGWVLLRVHRIDVVHVTKAWIILEENRETKLLAQSQVSATVRDRVGALLIRDVERRSHTLARLFTPGERPRIDPRGG